MQKGQYKIIITRHASEQAFKRRIHEDIIEDTIHQGRMEFFGKNRVKIVKGYTTGEICCVDEIVNETITIVTITRKVKK